MISPKLQSNPNTEPGFRADAVVGETMFEVVRGLRDVRKLRAAALEMARAADSPSLRNIVLLLDEPEMTAPRIRTEWEAARAVLRPDLAERVSVAIHSAGHWDGIPQAPDTGLTKTLEQVLQHECAGMEVRPKRRTDSFFEVLRILILRWMKRQGPVNVAWLQETSGFSYPTVARALDRLAPYLEPRARGVNLALFPEVEWNRLVATSDEVRRTVRYSDRSGQPRSPASLLRRLKEMNVQNVAVGGVWGAAHYWPGLDVIGRARLDLCLFVKHSTPDYAFVERLDPGLGVTTQPDEATRVAVHLIRRKIAFFEASHEGPAWADPVECLLDLHDARLEPQAREFLHSFTRSTTAV